MHEFEERFRSAHGHLAEAAVIVDGLERALAKAHSAEVRVEREVAFTAKAAVVVVGAAVAVIVGTLVLRWFFENPGSEPYRLGGADSSFIQTADTV